MQKIIMYIFQLNNYIYIISEGNMPRFKKGKSPFTKNISPHDHEESRGAVCWTCLQKERNLSNITQTLKKFRAT